MTAISGTLPATRLGNGGGNDRARLGEAARGFEAIFIRQMLAAARQADFGDPLLGGSGNGGGLDTFRQMQDDRFAQIASESGAFGLAKQLEAHFAQMLPPEPAP